MHSKKKTFREANPQRFFLHRHQHKKREKNLSTNLASGGQVFSSSNIKQNDKHTKKFNKIRSRPFSKISDLKMDKYNAIQCPNHILYFFITTSSGYQLKSSISKFQSQELISCNPKCSLAFDLLNCVIFFGTPPPVFVHLFYLKYCFARPKQWVYVL